MSKRSGIGFRMQIFFGFMALVLVTVLLATISIISVRRLITNAGWVQHTYNVIGKGELLILSLVDQETGVRGFLVTGDSTYLEPYTSGLENFETELANLKNTVSDNPAQLARLEAIGEQAEKLEQEFSSRAISLRYEVNVGKDTVAAFDEIRSRTVGKEIFDRMRSVITGLEQGFARAGDTTGRSLVRDILLDLVNMETGQRGFLLTGLEESLEPYRAGRDSFERNLTRLEAYVAGNLRPGIESGDVAPLRRLVLDWSTEAADVEIDARREVNAVSATETDIADFMAMGIGKTYMDELRVLIAEFISIEQELLVKRDREAKQTAMLSSVIGIAGMTLSVFIGLTIAMAITRLVKRQIGGEPGVIAGIAERIALGDLDVTLKRSSSDQGIYASMVDMVDTLQSKAATIEGIADQDLTVDVQIVGDNDKLGRSLLSMKENLNHVLAQVTTAVEQVNIGSDQIAQSSQVLSQGAIEQASSLEQISASATEVKSQSDDNARNSTEAVEIARNAVSRAREGNNNMEDLISAMERINTSSDEINKIVKVIDDIAFQINLLALNANVEAARAGKYGKGFAVVAEEVRNLATRSAAAVRETTAMVEDSKSNLEQGNKAAEITAQSLQDIVEGIDRVSGVLVGISDASLQQAQGISEVSSGLEQVEQVTQGTSAGAEESAATSEELASQAANLRAILARFRLDNTLRQLRGGPVPASVSGNPVSSDYEVVPQVPADAMAPAVPVHLDDGNFGNF